MAIEKFAFVDVETTGLDPEVHEIIELAYIITDRNLNVLSKYSTKILPENIEAASPRALEINGYSPDLWDAEAVPLCAALNILDLNLPWTYLAGHNVGFDRKFIEAAYKKLGRDTPWRTYHMLDTSSLAMPLFFQGKIPSLSLSVLCDYFSVTNEKAHSALSDIQATLEIAQNLMEYFE